jgi:carbon storage regulator
MLVLTRRTGETLKIGDDVSITILGIKGNQVRLGLDAPRGVAVRRGELAPQSRPLKALTSR